MSYYASREYDTVELPCHCAESHESHYAYVRQELGGRAVLEVFETGTNEGEVAGIYRAVFHSIVDWDLPGPEGEVLPITQQVIDELHLELFNKLRGPAVAALKKGNTPLPNGSGERSPSTSPGNRSRRRSTKA
jgi:hypothetical protein